MKNARFDLSGRTALVTGGGQGLGKAIALGFGQAGADLFLCSRTESSLRDAAADISARTGARVEYGAVDMSRRQDVARIAVQAIERMGKIDILVNNAGQNIPQAIDEVCDEDWDYLVELNLGSVMALTRALAPGMKQRRWGRVIHISSIMGLASAAARNAYSATKAALIGLVKANALDLGPFGITANCIAPGPFRSELPMSILSQEQKEAFRQRTALGRWGDPEELIGPALLLASDAGSYITGTVLVVDGGVLSRIF